MRKLLKTPPFFLLFLVLTINFCYASANVNMTEVPNQLATRLSVSVFTAQLIMVAILMIAFTLPIAVWGNQQSILLSTVMVFLIQGVCVAIGWLDVWTMLMTILIVSAVYAITWKNGIG